MNPDSAVDMASFTRRAREVSRGFEVRSKGGQTMIDHTGVSVSNFDKSKNFYSQALKPIGYELIVEFPASITVSSNVAGFGEPPKADFWIIEGTPNEPRIHVAFRATRCSLVDAFHRAALAAGGRDNAAPGTAPPIIIRIITARSFWTPTATTSKWSATIPNKPKSSFKVPCSRVQGQSRTLNV